ncbi:MAG TPA: hypothetical protein VJB57_02985 [Dehalococcoidia bacterium]|nr:hypothetical protein [Dehalococcoidia bacterium]
MFQAAINSNSTSSSVQVLDVSRSVRIIRAAVLAAGLFASLAVGSLGMPSDAEARVKKGDSGALADACRTLQSDYDTASDELAKLGMGGANAQKRYDLRNRLQQMRNAWGEYCEDAFGSIVYFEPAPTNGEVGPLNGAVDGGQGVQDKDRDTAAPTSGGVFDPGQRGGGGTDKGKGYASTTTAGVSRGLSPD